MTTKIQNFTNAYEIEISAHPEFDKDNQLVVLSQHSGAFSFVHAMTPEQAEETAAALLTYANKARGTIPE